MKFKKLCKLFFNVNLFIYLIIYFLFFVDYPHRENESLTKEIVFDVVHYIYPPEATGLQTSRKSTWVRPIIDGEDETAIRGKYQPKFIYY